ncbi:methyltransferase domain-containing protein [Porphyrobacter sp. GA68]|uniref:methyltransferase domain-containing protein n=1 Tax=Porphyrobacter sp. GA68 TaxID=2883480 RepID=UPI001D1953CD|nr:methyltransferase domain-containing protein [Porphyrobacter sp. GA68]
MDNPALPADVYAAVLRDLARVNRITLAYRPTLAFIRRAVGGRQSFSVLDVGFGDGDMLRSIAKAAAARGQRARLVGVDLNLNSVAAAQAATSPDLPIAFRHGDYADLAGEGWDCVISSLVAHHMSHDQLIAFLRFMDAEAQAGWFVNDLHRHGFAYLGYPVLARLMNWHPIVRRDGRTSIARSYRPAEWPAILAEAEVGGARVFRAFPFRLGVEKLR